MKMFDLKQGIEREGVVWRDCDTQSSLAAVGAWATYTQRRAKILDEGNVSDHQMSLASGHVNVAKSAKYHDISSNLLSLQETNIL